MHLLLIHFLLRIPIHHQHQLLLYYFHQLIYLILMSMYLIYSDFLLLLHLFYKTISINIIFLICCLIYHFYYCISKNKPNEKWLTDVTEFKLLNGQKAYLSALFDLAAIANPDAKPLFHSDMGFKYTNRTFKAKLDKINTTQSMSRVSRCIDNGLMEGFWGTLKCEMYYLQKFYIYEELRPSIDEYIVFYNTKRLRKI